MKQTVANKEIQLNLPYPGSVGSKSVRKPEKSVTQKYSIHNLH